MALRPTRIMDHPSAAPKGVALRSQHRGRLAAIGLVAALAAIGCSTDYTAPAIYNLDRPSAIAFACFGDLRITSGEPSSADHQVVRSAQPLESCRLRTLGEVPTGQESDDALGPPLQIPQIAAFALQPSRGTVALITFSAEAGGIDGAAVVDSDPLTPGKNAIPIGTLPVGLVSGAAGCHLISANAGSCDLSILDVNSALDQSTPALIERVVVENSSGEPMRAKPRAIVAEPPSTDIGFVCPDRSVGLVYVAYPGCHTVAAIDSATGAVMAGIRFDSGGGITLTDGDITCPAECGGGGVADADPGAPRPGTLHMAEDGARLYIGADDLPAVVVVDLDADRLPVAATTVDLEGEVGVTALAASPVIDMGGDLGIFGEGIAGQFQFVYAIATDRSVRVVEVGTTQRECDTQVDPRYLHDVTDVTWLSCMPAGDVTTPPRRPGAWSPGITLPRETVPLDVAFASVTNGDTQVEGEPSAVAMVGVFAFITASNGFIYVANVDDDKYPDFENPDDPLAAFVPLALAHQLRDFGSTRNAVDGIESDGTVATKCLYPDADTLAKGPRLASQPDLTFYTNYLSAGKRNLLPSMHGVLCTNAEDQQAAVPELAFAADLETRERAFPDLEGTKTEQWTLTWEGTVSLDNASTSLDGPPVRSGYVEVGEEVALVDGSAPYCAAGMQPYDIVVFSGCDPAGSNQCGVGETCYVHPESPTLVTTGLCLPESQVDQLAGVCKGILTSRRRYSVREAYKDRLVLGERRRVLTTTPVDGCDSVEQCNDLAELALEIMTAEHPVDVIVDPAARRYSWACEPDGTRAPGPDRCVMTCDTAVDCEDGWTCSQGRCVEGPLPPAECVTAQQRYQLRVGDAFSVIGQITGFLHHRIADLVSGECLDDPDGNPLLVGRLSLDAPPCVGDDYADLSPNPCSTTVEEVEEYYAYTFSGGVCAAPTTTSVRTVEVPAVRFQNPAMRFHLVDPSTHGDANCISDRAGTWPAFRTVHPSFQIRFILTGGFIPMFITNVTVAFPIDITPGPEGGLWILDQGDVSSSLSTQGRIVHIDPNAASSSFAAKTLR